MFNRSKLLITPEKDFTHCQAPNAVVLPDRVRIYFTSRSKMTPTLSEGYWIDYSLDMKRVLGRAKQPILEPSEAGRFDDCGTYPISVLRKDDIYYAYYGGWTKLQTVPFDISLGLATSLDGKTFTRHSHGPIKTKSTDHPSVVTSPKIRHFDGKFYLYYTAGTGQWVNGHPIYKLYASISNDGIIWSSGFKLIDVGDAQACPDVFYHNKKYHLFYCHRTIGKGNTDYSIAYATSATPYGPFNYKKKVIIPKTKYDKDCQAYPHVFKVQNKIYMLYNGNKVGVDGILLTTLKGDL